jgi:hypothetical protein
MAGPYDKFSAAFEVFQQEIHTELQTLRDEIILHQQTSLLTVYDVIVRIRSVPTIGVVGYYEPRVYPFFADVFNDVVRYLGESIIGMQFQEKAREAFSYLPHGMNDEKHMPRFLRESVKPDANGVPDPRQLQYIVYSQHEFDVLRSILESL